MDRVTIARNHEAIDTFKLKEENQQLKQEQLEAKETKHQKKQPRKIPIKLKKLEKKLKDQERLNRIQKESYDKLKIKYLKKTYQDPGAEVKYLKDEVEQHKAEAEYKDKVIEHLKAEKANHIDIINNMNKDGKIFKGVSKQLPKEIKEGKMEILPGKYIDITFNKNQKGIAPPEIKPMF